MTRYDTDHAFLSDFSLFVPGIADWAFCAGPSSGKVIYYSSYPTLLLCVVIYDGIRLTSALGDMGERGKYGSACLRMCDRQWTWQCLIVLAYCTCRLVV